MSLNPFHAQEPSEQRPASEVFRSSATQQSSAISARFASSGKFTHEQLEEGADAAPAAAASNEPEFDPDDKRSLYERLKAQQDAKQEEWERAHTFKNQMDHWRLDEDEAAFEEERVAKLQQQEAEASRLHEEGAQFYKLARAAQDRTVQQPALAPKPAAEGSLKRKPPPPKPSVPAFKVLKVQPRQGAGSSAPVSSSATPAAASATSATAAATSTPVGLPGMGAYDDDDDDDEDD